MLTVVENYKLIGSLKISSNTTQAVNTFPKINRLQAENQRPA
jgi:hypothetical protein